MRARILGEECPRRWGRLAHALKANAPEWWGLRAAGHASRYEAAGLRGKLDEALGSVASHAQWDVNVAPMTS